jgi:ribosome-associated heat shock protein Hsp15
VVPGVEAGAPGLQQGLVGVVDEVRVDRWLWAVRVYRTRTAATDACRAGHVRVRGGPAKPASAVRVGDIVEVRVEGWDRRLQVLAAIERRVSASVAATCALEHNPPPPRTSLSPPMFVRVPSAGRPTKRERRALDRLRGR